MAENLKFKWYDYIPLAGAFTFYERNLNAMKATTVQDMLDFNNKSRQLANFNMYHLSTSLISITAGGLISLLK